MLILMNFILTKEELNFIKIFAKTKETYDKMVEDKLKFKEDEYNRTHRREARQYTAVKRFTYKNNALNAKK